MTTSSNAPRPATMLSRLLITGACGNLGKMLRAELADAAEILRLSDLLPCDEPEPHEEWVTCNLADASAVEKLLEGVEAVVHLGGQSSEADWPAVLNANIVGAINLWEAARKSGTRRIVFASSNHAIGMYPRDATLDHTSPARPDSRYGVSKAFGEDLANFYAQKYGIEAFCIRIGSAFALPKNSRMLSTWISYRDLAQLVRTGLTASFQYEIVYGVSANSRSWWDNANAYRLGYRPLDNAETFAQSVLHIAEDDGLARELQGGSMAAAEYVDQGRAHFRKATRDD